MTDNNYQQLQAQQQSASIPNNNSTGNNTGNNNNNDNTSIIQKLQKQLETTAEENFELHAALSAVDVEVQYKLQQAAQASQQTERTLREQLRRTQQEANLATSQLLKVQSLEKKHSKNNSFPPLGGAGQAFVVQPAAGATAEHQSVVTPTNRNSAAVVFETTKAHHDQDSAVLSAVTHQPNSGAALARHLLRNAPATTPDHVGTHLARIAVQNNNNDVSDVIQILVDQVVDTQTLAPAPWTWLHAALVLVAPAPKMDDDAILLPSQQQQRYRRRRSKFRRLGKSSSESHVQEDWYTRALDASQSPFWTPQQQATPRSTVAFETMLLPNNNATTTSIRSCSFQKALCQLVLQPWRDIPTAMVGLKILHHLLPHVAASDWESWWSPLMTMNTTRRPENKETLLELWQGAASFLIMAAQQDDAQQQPPVDLEFPANFRRLPHPEDFTASGTENNNSPVTATTASSNAWAAKVDATVIREWMAVCLDVFIQFWTVASDADRQRYYCSSSNNNKSPIARQLLATVLDVVEVCLLPHPATYCDPLTFSCVSWWHALLKKQPPQLLMLLRMPTTASTDESWHRACSAVGVAIKLFHEIVVQQHRDDHLPGSSNSQYDAIRDHLIRLVHGLLVGRVVDKTVLQHHHHRTTTTPFAMMVTSEYPELYTSAASLLLGSTANLIREDIRVMLQRQMDEICMDQQERLERMIAKSGTITLSRRRTTL